jgi:hypothetical protein
LAARVFDDPPPVEPPGAQSEAARTDTPAARKKPKQEFVPDRATERVRKKVERKYENGKLGAKPKRATLARLPGRCGTSSRRRVRAG